MIDASDKELYKLAQVINEYVGENTFINKFSKHSSYYGLECGVCRQEVHLCDCALTPLRNALRRAEQYMREHLEWDGSYGDGENTFKGIGFYDDE